MRIYEPGDEEGIVDLLSVGFSGWPNFDLKCDSVDHWKWKYLDNPYGKISIAVALDSEKIIGCVHTGYRKINVDGQIILGGQAMDGVIHPDYRGKGVYNLVHKLMNNKRQKDGVIIGTGITRNPIIIERALRRGTLRFPHAVLSMYRIQDVDLHLKMRAPEVSWIKKTGYKGLQFFQTLYSTRIRDDDFDVLVGGYFDDRVDVFWDDLKDKYSFIVERNLDYLTWRYSDLRGGKYDTIQVFQDGVLVGYSVLRVNEYQEDYPLGYIVDLIAFPLDVLVQEKLVRESIDFFDERNVNVIMSFVVKGHPFENTMKKFGFVNVRIENHVFLTSLSPSSKDLVQKIIQAPPEKLLYQYGDADWI